MGIFEKERANEVVFIQKGRMTLVIIVPWENFFNAYR